MGDQNNSSVLPRGSDEKRRVAFDVSVLGYARYGAGGRTGVFRMVDELARALARQADCELAFCGGENLRMWNQAWRTLQTDPELHAVPALSYRASVRAYGFLSDKFWPLTRERKIPLAPRLWRKVLGSVLRALDHHAPALRHSALRGWDVYHSPFYGLPASTQGVKGLARFLTVCDLINIQHPQFSRDGGAFLKQILATLRPSDWAMTISQTTKDDLCTYRADLNPNRVFVMPLAASESFRPVPAQPKVPYVLSVCTLDARKNIEALLWGFAVWLRQEKVSDVELWLAGSPGEAMPRIRRTLEDLGLPESRVQFLGYVPDEALASLYSGALAFVYPSFYEGFGLPVLEAMQCGTPVVTTDRGALKEVAQNAAWLVDPDRPEEIAAALNALYRSSSKREELSRLGLERAREYSWEHSVQRLLAAYEVAAVAREPARAFTAVAQPARG